MGEGVDPTQMCRSLVDKVARSQQLMALADPELLVLFEEWLEALEEEIVSQVRDTGFRDPEVLARNLSIPLSGVNFLLNKLAREGKL